MSSVEMTALLKGMQGFVDVFGQLGLPGLLMMVLLAPALVLMLILYMNHLATVRMEKAQAEYRSSSMSLLEAYREDTQNLLQDMGDKHSKLMRVHEDTLLQLKSSLELNAALYTLIINNTTAMEQLKISIDRR